MKELGSKNIAITAVILAVVINGAGPVFTKIALRELSPEFFSFLRFLVASITLLPLFLRSGIKFDQNLLKLVSISLLSTLNILFFAHGIKLTTATIGQLLYVLGPVAITIFSYFLIKEKITFPKVTGVALGVFGAGFVILLPVINKGVPFMGDFRGDLIILCGVLIYSLYTVFTKKLQTKYSPIQITMVFSLTTTISMLILSLPQILSKGSEIFTLSQNAVISVLYVGALSTAFFYLLYQYAIKHGSPLIASIVLLLGPFSTITWASLLIGEKLTAQLAFGALFVLAGAFLIVRSNNQKFIDTKSRK